MMLRKRSYVFEANVERDIAVRQEAEKFFKALSGYVSDMMERGGRVQEESGRVEQKGRPFLRAFETAGRVFERRNCWRER